LPAGPSKKLQSAKVKVEPSGGTCPLQLRGSTSKIILSLFFFFFTTVQKLMIACSENIKGKQERKEYYGSIISSVDH
jgi:hypothetical protein